MMLVNGSRIYIGTRVPQVPVIGLPEIYAQDGEWAEITGWISVGQIGDEQEVIQQAVLSRGRTLSGKGIRNARLMGNSFLPGPRDPGQQRLLIAANDCTPYAFKIEWGGKCGVSKNISFFYAFALPSQVQGGDANTPLATTTSLAIISNIFEHDGELEPKTAIGYARSLVEGDTGDVAILVIGDSTGNDASDWVYQFAIWLGTEYPRYTIKHRSWNGIDAYEDGTTISSGSGPNTLTIFNACIAGSRPARLMGGQFAAAIGDLSPDLIIWNHGQNVYASGMADANYQGEFYAAFDQVRAAHPTVVTAAILQNPRRDDDNMAAVVASLRSVAPYYGEIIDVYSRFLELGKDPNLYTDNIHPNAEGSLVWRDVVISAWRGKGPVAPVLPALTSIEAPNLLANGDFSNWTAALPANWSSGSSGSATKDAAITDGSAPYSCKVTGTTAGANIVQILNTSQHAGKTVFLAVRQYVLGGQPGTVGRIYLRYDAGGTTIITTRANTYGVDGFCWQMLGPITLPPNTTAVRVVLYCDSAANAGSAANYDRAILSESNGPRGMA